MATALKNTETYPVGTVDFATKGVTATESNGVVHALTAGTQVHYGDLIKTGNNGMVVISLDNGERFDLGRNSEALLDADVLGYDAGAARAQAVMEAEALAAALEAGADPTELMEATAAGGRPGAGDDESSDSAEEPVVIYRTGAVGDINAGHDSAVGQSRNFENLEEVTGVAFAGLEETIPLEEPEEPEPNVLSDSDETVLTDEDTSISGNVLDNTVNPDGPNPESVTGSYSWGGQSAGVGTAITLEGIGELIINADGSYTFTPEQDYADEVPDATYTVTDGEDIDESNLSIGINPVNDLADGNEYVSTAYDTIVSGNLLENTFNPDGPEDVIVTGYNWNDGEVVRVGEVGSWVTMDGYGELLINQDGSYEFNPSEDYEGGVVPAISYTVFDGLDSDESILSISVGEPEEPDPELVLPETIPEPVIPFSFSKVTGLGSENMELKFSIFDSGTLVAGGTAFFNATDNSGNKTFSWEFDVDSLTLEKDVNYTVELYSEVGQNAIIHNPALFGMPLMSANGHNANIHPQPDIDNDGNLVEPWEDSVSFSFLSEEPSVTFDVSGDSNLLIGDANSGKDVIYDTPQDDTVIGLDGDDELYASEGNDTLIGGADDDILVGGSGNDILFGGEGDDDLTGGEGADTFVWNEGDTGEDVIHDFSLDESDQLNIADLLSDENVTADTVHEYVHAGTSGDDLILTIDPAGDVQSGGDYQITLVGAADLESQSLVDLLNQLQGTDVL